jgi:hypothetical protein
MVVEMRTNGFKGASLSVAMTISLIAPAILQRNDLWAKKKAGIFEEEAPNR